LATDKLNSIHTCTTIKLLLVNKQTMNKTSFKTVVVQLNNGVLLPRLERRKAKWPSWTIQLWNNNYNYLHNVTILFIPPSIDIYMASKAKKSKSTTAIQWKRINAGEKYVAAVDCEIDVALVESLLARRWAAKLEKDYDQADDVSNTLKSMGVVYHDEEKSWYTRDLSATNNTSVTPVVNSSISRDKKRKSKEKLRNIRQSKKNKRKKSGLQNNSTSVDGESTTDEVHEEVSEPISNIQENDISEMKSKKKRKAEK
jgi:hypothetical protein